MTSEKAFVTAVVVTYNRKQLLAECLQALLQQTRRPDRILVINNASTDGTEALFAPGGAFAQPDQEQTVSAGVFARPAIELVNLPVNVGGAGGFCEGIRRAAGAVSGDVRETTGPDRFGESDDKTETEPFASVKTGPVSVSAPEIPDDAVWIMDDDTIPEPGALEGLLKAWSRLDAEGAVVSFLASTVFGPGGEPMNVPVLDNRKTDNGYADWYRWLSLGCVAIKEATFVSLLLSGEAVRKVGLPIAGYFIWGDDTEYTRRLVSDFGPAYLCGGSRVMHKRFNVRKISVWQENDAGRVNMYFFYFRNALYNAAEYEGKARTALRWLGYMAMSFTAFFRRGQKHRVKKFCVIQKGCWAFLFQKTPH